MKELYKQQNLPVANKLDDQKQGRHVHPLKEADEIKPWGKKRNGERTTWQFCGSPRNH